MRTLILGGGGFVGSVIAKHLATTSEIQPVVASRHPKTLAGIESLTLDATDPDALQQAIESVDAVINCVAGSGDTIRNSAAALATAVRLLNKPISLIHMSTMSVYGNQQGVVTESTRTMADGNWYGQAKIDAERSLQALSESDSRIALFRIGCVYGPGSSMWVDRIGLLIRSGRLGNLGAQGDGWSNLIHVNDIATAACHYIDNPRPGVSIYNLAAPDSPRWNDYFKSMCRALDATPLRFKTSLAMTLESKLVAPPVKIWERLSDRRILPPLRIQCMPPSLLGLWGQQIRLDSDKIEDELKLEWTSYQSGVEDSARYFLEKYGR